MIINVQNNTSRFGIAKRLNQIENTVGCVPTHRQKQFELIKIPKLYLNGASGRTLRDHFFPSLHIGVMDLKELFCLNKKIKRIYQR
ncbi:MAG: hypothetical protein U9N49_11825 [Campylobacterota bacterium]|nr:hypothetical protein [Campylobacterota bacterium]